MTRNTKLFKVTVHGKDILFRTLNINELSFLENISNSAVKFEQAAKLAITDGYDPDLNFMILHQIGEQAISQSVSVGNDDELFKLTVEDLRMKVKSDTILSMVTNLLNLIPNISFEYLITQTYTDLIELMCVAERLHNKKLFNNIDKKMPPPTSVRQNDLDIPIESDINKSEDGHSYFDDTEASMSLADKMAADKKFFKEK